MIVKALKNATPRPSEKFFVCKIIDQSVVVRKQDSTRGDSCQSDNVIIVRLQVQIRDFLPLSVNHAAVDNRDCAAAVLLNVSNEFCL
jgi:hypothetical protein